MADISFTGKDKISVIHLPESSGFPLGGSINITDLTNLTELYDQLGSAGKGNKLRQIVGFNSNSSLRIFDFGESNASFGSSFLSEGFPSQMENFKFKSDLSRITGPIPPLPSTMKFFTLQGNNNPIVGGLPAIPADMLVFQLRGNKMNFSGTDFLPSSLPEGIFHFVATNQGDQQLGTHRGELPNLINVYVDTNKLTSFNVLNMQLKGDLHGVLPYRLTTYKIGGRTHDLYANQYLNINQTFPDFGNCVDLKTLVMTNLKGGLYNPRIISCAGTAFSSCIFPNNTNIDLRFNSFRPTLTAQVLNAIRWAIGAGQSRTGRIIRMDGNEPPANLISMSGTSGGSADTGNADIDYLIDNNWSFTFNSTSNLTPHGGSQGTRLLWPL